MLKKSRSKNSLLIQQSPDRSTKEKSRNNSIQLSPIDKSSNKWPLGMEYVDKDVFKVK